MSDAVARKWRRANRLASCRCKGKGYAATLGRSNLGGPLTRWANVHEYWNYGIYWHLLVAGLILDGIACEDLP